MRQLILTLAPDAAPTLANFRPAGNGEAYDCLCALAAGAPAEAVIYLWGPAGSGKTHLLRATVAAVRMRGETAHYVAAGEPIPEADGGLLAVDDVERLDAVAQVALFDRINAAREGAGTVLAAGTVPPAHLTLRPDLATRLAWGLTYALTPLSDADKRTALAEHARARGMRLPDEVVTYLLTHCRRELRALIALVDALDEYSLSLRRPVSLPLLKALLKERGG
ncbi:MAG: DnaA regulatory inactivator Hda [Thiobacillaceae bacterium]|nr:DnaA regulatory inactivator Hda [Thiobacillaceae bacterium]